jgi:hypothetical protein
VIAQLDFVRHVAQMYFALKGIIAITQLLLVYKVNLALPYQFTRTAKSLKFATLFRTLVLSKHVIKIPNVVQTIVTR